jgi:hypothetical protein
MTDRKPSDDLKEGLFLLFRAARGAAQEVSKEIDATKVEKAINTGARELARAIENVGKSLSSELEKTFQDKDSPPDPSSPKAPTPDDPPRDDPPPPR